MTRIACLDIGSTFTKGCLLDARTGELLGTAQHPTTVADDVLRGVDAVLARLGDADEVRACSSAGGGLRLAVVGYERVVTAEAGRLVGLTAGARVVHVSAGPVDVPSLRAARPDLVLLVGGTDGGDADMLLRNAAALNGVHLPVVLAGNADARARAAALLTRTPVVVTENVLPRIGALNPAPARAAVRQVFLRHVIGGKNLSTGTRLRQYVRGATPDIVLTGVQVLARAAGCDVLVLDIGGATTDVYSAVTLHGAPGVAGALPLSRTVEGDLGMRHSAPGVVEAAGLTGDTELCAAAARRADDPGYLPHNSVERAHDDRIAALAATLALRRHARPSTGDGRVPADRRDLRTVRLVVGSGGVLRAHPLATLRAALTDTAGGVLQPDGPALAVDTDHVLAAAGLLADDHPRAAAHLAGRLARNLVGGTVADGATGTAAPDGTAPATTDTR